MEPRRHRWRRCRSRDIFRINAVRSQKLVDALSDPSKHGTVWAAFALLIAFIAADNLAWRLAAWIGHATFSGVTGRVRRKLFGHLTGHAPSFFQGQAPGALTSRITATANALYTAETVVTFNCMPPLVATVVSIIYLTTVSVSIALVLTGIVAVVVVIMFYWAARGTPLHHGYAREAANVDGDMIDVVSNISVVKSFGRMRSEHRRLGGVIGREIRARKESLYFLERLRIFHAITTAVLTSGSPCLVSFALAGGPRDTRRRYPRMHPRHIHLERHPRSRGRACRCHATSRSVFRSAADLTYSA